MGNRRFILNDDDLNGLQIESIHKLIERAKLGNFTNAQLRIEGKYEYHEADWIKFLRRDPDSDRIKELEGHIERIVEAKRKQKRPISIGLSGAITAASKALEDS